MSVGDAAKAVINEAIMPALEKLIPQGAAELAQGLYTGNAYVPYGPTEAEIAAPSSEPNGYDQQLAQDAAAMSTPEPPAQEMER